MIIDVISLLPEIIAPTCEYGVVGRARQKDELYEVHYWNPRDYVTHQYRSVDERPYGGGPGMVMMYEPLKRVLDHISATRSSRGLRIFMSPQGEVLRQKRVQQLAEVEHLVILCGRYEGVDQRLIDTEIDLELSIGEYVISGGELAAAILIDSIVRLLPGALGNEASHIEDSFTEENVYDHPHYTRPVEINGLRVPEVLLSGNHKKIAQWRAEEAEKIRLKRQKSL